jgi:formate/nitrite transporter FocA (FNT family)
MLRKWLKLNNTIELLNITTYKHKRNMKKYLLFTIAILCNLMVQAQKMILLWVEEEVSREMISDAIYSCSFII